MKAFADVVVGDKIQYGASDLFRTVTDIEKGRGVNGFTVFVVLDGLHALRLTLVIGFSASRRVRHEETAGRGGGLHLRCLLLPSSNVRRFMQRDRHCHCQRWRRGVPALPATE